MYPSSRSLWPRMILAVVLLVGFYVIALGIAGGLLFGIYAQVLYGEGISVRLSVVLLLGAGAILYAIFPRSDSFDPPWPRLNAIDQPRLFDKLLELSTATQQEMPKEVYLIPDVNAWVADRGGRMGYGSRRVMGIGLPLMQVLSVPELGAILAHEFGHYYGGDTRLGPWLYKTRATIGRTLDTLEETNRILKIPFTLYGKLFLRTTQAVSRRQEFLADNFAARTMGTDNFANALKAVHGQAPGFVYYWNEFVGPVLDAGYRPQIMEGYSRFISSTATEEMVAQSIQHELDGGKRNPYDSHPTLRERIDAVAAVTVEGDTSDEVAITLLDNVEGLEDKLLELRFLAEGVAKLEPIDWEDVGEKVYLPTWRKWHARNKTVIKGWTPAQLPEATEQLGEFVRGLRAPNGETIPREHWGSAAAYTLSVGFAMALLREGWEFVACPSKGIYFTHGENQVDPFTLVTAFATSGIDTREWGRECKKMDVAYLDLGGDEEGE